MAEDVSRAEKEIRPSPEKPLAELVKEPVKIEFTDPADKKRKAVEFQGFRADCYYYGQEEFRKRLGERFTGEQRLKATVEHYYSPLAPETQKAVLARTRQILKEEAISPKDSTVSLFKFFHIKGPEIVEGVVGETLEARITELQGELRQRNKRIEKMLADINKGEEDKRRLQQGIRRANEEIRSLKAKLEKPPAPLAPTPLEGKPFAVAAVHLESNLRAIKALDLLLHKDALMTNETAKQVDARTLLNEALSLFPDLKELKSELHRSIETRITVSKEGLSPQEFEKAERVKREEYLTAVGSLLADLEKVYEVRPPPTKPPKKEAKEPIKIPKTFLEKLKMVNQLLQRESSRYRPPDKRGRPGGLVELRKDIPTILIPDLHARPDYLAQALLNTPGDWEKFINGELQVVCLGDAPHSEDEEIWKKAYDEYIKSNGYQKGIGPATEKEMQGTFGTMEMILTLKLLFPENFHYLRGNHDELGKANFHKLALEGPQTKAYVKAKYDQEFYQAYCQFEENLLLVARGNNFIASHAEPPLRPASVKEKIINYRDNPKISFNLRWSRDTGPEAINQFLKNMGVPNGYLFSGHTDREQDFYQDGQYVSVGFRENHRCIAKIDSAGKPEIINVSKLPHTAEELKRRIAKAIKQRKG